MTRTQAGKNTNKQYNDYNRDTGVWKAQHCVGTMVVGITVQPPVSWRLLDRSRARRPLRLTRLAGNDPARPLDDKFREVRDPELQPTPETIVCSPRGQHGNRVAIIEVGLRSRAWRAWRYNRNGCGWKQQSTSIIASLDPPAHAGAAQGSSPEL